MVLDGALDRDKLAETFVNLIERHESLRTSFTIINGEPVQKIYETVELTIEYGEAKEEEIDSTIRKMIRPFDLGVAPLIRVGLVKLADQRHLLLVDMHHIISDGVSAGIITEEFSRFYQGETLPELRVQYKDYVFWQRKLLAGDKLKAEEDYWLEQFKEEVTVLNLPTDFKRPAVQNYAGRNIKFYVNSLVTEKLYKLARSKKATLYIVLLAAYNTLLYRYTQQEDIIVGSPIAGRPHVDLQQIVGMFVNTLAMRNNPAGDKTFSELLAEVKENALRAYENQDYQFEELIEKLDIERDLNRNPLFDTMFTLQNMDLKPLEIPGLKIILDEYDSGTAKFDLSLTAIERENDIELSLRYNTQLFLPKTVERFGRHYLNILKDVTSNSEILLKEIEILSESEKEQLVFEFNNTSTDYPKEQTIQLLFEGQVLKTPDHIAVVFGDHKLTYRELNEKANQLARLLRAKGVVGSTVTAIMLERSVKLIFATLAVLKAGSAYLPIDPDLPKERIEYILLDSQTDLLLTQSDFIQKVKFAGEIIDIENAEIYRGENSNLSNITTPDSPVYMIYTSGTTGKPKGVLIRNESLVNYTSWFSRKVDLTEKDKGLLVSSFAFDLGYTVVYPALLNGCELHLAEREI